MPDLQLNYGEKYSLRARVQNREGKDQLCIGWWHNDKTVTPELWLDVDQAGNILRTLAAFADHVAPPR